MRSSRLPLGALIVAVALGLTFCRIARSNEGLPSDDRVQLASKHFQHGVKLSEDGDWRAALIEFERAFAIAPNFRVLFDIGQCRYQLHDYPGALSAFQKYLAEGGDQVPADRRSQVEADVELLKGRVAKVRVSTSLPGAEVSVDDAVVGSSPLPSPVVVSVGRHKIAAAKSGYPGALRYVEVTGEDTLDVPLDLGRPALSPAPAPSRGRLRVPALVSFGVSAAAAGVGAYFGLRALEDKRDLDRVCVHSVCPTSSQSTFDNAQRDALVSTVALGVAVAAAGTGIFLFAFASAHDSAKSGRTSPRVRVSAGLLSLAATGAF